MNTEDIKAAISKREFETLKYAVAQNERIKFNSIEEIQNFASLFVELQNDGFLYIVDELLTAENIQTVYFYAIDHALQDQSFESAKLLAQRCLQHEGLSLNADIWEAYIHSARLTQKPDFMRTHKGFKLLIEKNMVSLFRAIKYHKAFEALLEGGSDTTVLNEKGESLSYVIVGSPVTTDIKQQLLYMLGPNKISIQPCGEFSISPAFYCIRLGHIHLFEYFTLFPGLEKVRTAAGENIVHYICRYDHSRLLRQIPKEYLVPLFAEQDSSGVFALERFAMSVVDGYNDHVYESFVSAFKQVIRRGETMQHYNRVVEFLGKELVPYLLDEIAAETAKKEIPWFNETSFAVSELPQDILQLICNLLPLNDVMELSRVSKSILIKITTKMLRNCLVNYKPMLKLEQIPNWRKKFAEEARHHHNWMTGKFKSEKLTDKIFHLLDLDENWLVIQQHQMTRSIFVLWNCHTKKTIPTESRLSGDIVSVCFLESLPNQLPTVAFYDGLQVKIFRGEKIDVVPITGMQNYRRNYLTVQPVAANILLFDGIVWNVNTNQELHTFKKENEDYHWSYCYNKFTDQYIIQVAEGVLDIYNKEFEFKKRIQFSIGGRSEVRLRMAIDDNVLLFRSTEEDFTLDLQTFQQQTIVQTKLLKSPNYHDLTRVIEASGVIFQPVNAQTKQHLRTYGLKCREGHEMSGRALANSKFLFFDTEKVYYDFR